MTPGYRYPWPSSAIGKEEMALLYLARESSPGKTAITELVARAVRAQYGHLAIKPEPSSEPERATSLRPAA